MKQATCRVYVNGRFAGTGSLIRKDTVITAAHLFAGENFSRTPRRTGRFSSEDSQSSEAKAFVEVLFTEPQTSAKSGSYAATKISAKLILLNQEIDLAFLSVDATGRTPVRLARNSSMGQKIMAPSYKHGKDLILPLGDIVGIYEDGILYNASAGGGSSGGPIVNLDGELVGICKGTVEGGLKQMIANHKTIREWLTHVEKTLNEVLK